MLWKLIQKQKLNIGSSFVSILFSLFQKYGIFLWIYANIFFGTKCQGVLDGYKQIHVETLMASWKC